MRPSFWSGTLEGDWTNRIIDLVVVGGGFAGLSTAYHCLAARPDLDVVILDRDEVGSGASGRNAGMVIPFPLFTPWLMDGSPSRADAIWGYAAWRNMLAELVAADNGQLLQARDADVVVTSTNWVWSTGLKWVGRRGRQLGFEVETFGSDEVSRRYGGAGQFGISYPGWSVQPWQTGQSLKRAVLAQGAQIAEGVAVVGISEGNGHVEVATASGQLRARRVVICTNAYSADIAGVGPQGKAVHTYMLATEPLPDGIAARLGGERALVSELGAGMIYRRVHDNRLIFGGLDVGGLVPTESAAQNEQSRAKLRALMQNCLPWLPELAIEREWGGAFVDREDPPNLSASTEISGLYFNTGYGGSGVAMTLPSGRLARGLMYPELDDPDAARLRQMMQQTRMTLPGLMRAGMEIVFGR